MKTPSIALATLLSASLSSACSDHRSRSEDAGGADLSDAESPVVTDEDAGEIGDDDATVDDEEDSALDDGADGAVEDGATDAADSATGDAGGEPDAGNAADSGASDAGASDAGAGDAGASDAGASDAGASDAGASDAGASDAGAGDAGASDAGAGASDAGAGGAQDGGLDGALADASSDGAIVVGADASSDGGTVVGPDAGTTGCDADNAGLTLPPGFCANVFASGLNGPRHIAVTPAGDLYVALKSSSNAAGSFAALRDSDGDGRADQRSIVGTSGGNGIFWEGGRLYFATDSDVLLYSAPSGTLQPTAGPITLVTGLPSTPDHYAKSIVVSGEHLYVNIGSATNACQVDNRTPGSPGVDPCPELATRSGVWKFMSSAEGQTEASGERIATGTRNLNALALNSRDTQVYAAQNGRDQLSDNWPALFTPADDQRLPAEGIYQIGIGDDYGWPYCYYDAENQAYLLAPEYGGDGQTVGRCSSILRYPIATLPAHWAPLGMVFYENSAFPAAYQHGAFIATHGSRFAADATGALPGYNVVFLPFDASNNVSGSFQRFAEGFAGAARPLPDAAAHRPVGVAVGPDGALFVSDDQGGFVYRITYRGTL